MTIITLTLIYLAVSNIYYSYFYEVKKEGLLYHLKKLTSYLIVSNMHMHSTPKQLFVLKGEIYHFDKLTETIISNLLCDKTKCILQKRKKNL